MQDDQFSKREEGTGSWMVECEDFRKWLNAKGAFLWCPGIPGAGKTVIASIITNHLRQVFCDKESIGVACIYFNYKEKELQIPVNILSCLLAQLVLTRKSEIEINLRVRDFHRLHRDRGVSPTLASMSGFLKQELAVLPQAYIVIDGLDECPNDDDNQSRTAILRVLLDLAQVVNVLITSRPLQDIEEYLNTSPRVISRLDIEARVEDVMVYVRSRMKKVELFSRLISRKPDLREEIVEKVSNGAQKMFLVARLHMDSVLGQGTVKFIKKTLASLPTTLDNIYSEALERIEGSMNVYNSSLAIQVLSWVSCAQRPLTLLEIQHAIAVELEASELDEDNLPDDGHLTSVCGGLVTANGSVVRLVHYTAQEYFVRLQYTKFSSAEGVLSAACLAYLSFDTFSNGYVTTDESMQAILQNNPFLDYAAIFWAHHSRKNKQIPRTQAQIARFLQRAGNIQFALQVASLPTERRSGFSQYCPKDMNALHVAANAGLAEAAQEVLLKSPDLLDKQDSRGRTPLYIAVHQGFTDVVRLLLKNGANVHAEEENFPGVLKGGRTAIFKAAQYGHLEIVQLLLQAGARVNKVDRGNQTALHWASWKGHEAVVDLLMRHGADERIVSAYGRTPLFFALWAEKKDVARRLIKEIPDNVQVRNSEDIAIMTRTGEEVQTGKWLLNRVNASLALGLSMWEGKLPLDIALNLRYASLVEECVISREPLSQYWRASDWDIQTWEKESWYPDLKNAVQACNTGAIETHICVATAVREDNVISYWHQEEDDCYLELAIPGDLPTPVNRIEIRTTSHDQGWCTSEEHETYFSQSWFEVGLKVMDADVGAAKTPIRKKIQANVVASLTMRTHTNICDFIPASDKWRDWLPEFKAGNIFQVFPKRIQGLKHIPGIPKSKILRLGESCQIC